MFERLEELLENSLVCNIAKGISLAVGLMFSIVTFVAAVCVFCFSPWWTWFLFALFSGIVAGIAFGFACYLFDEY